MFDPDVLAHDDNNEPTPKYWWQYVSSIDEAVELIRSIPVRLKTLLYRLGLYTVALAVFVCFGFGPSDALAQWTKGFNFRDSDTYCTDLGNDTYLRVESGVGSDDPYPTTRNGVTFGSLGSIGDNRRDRSAALNCKLAGITFEQNNAAAPAKIRVDVPASGDYNIRLAIGDTAGVGPATNQKVRIVDSDDSTVLATITAASVAANHHVDATGVDRTSESDWVNNNAQTTVTLSGTSLYIWYGYGDGSTSGYTALSHLEVDQVVVSTSSTTSTTSTSTTTTTSVPGAPLDHEICGDGVDNDLSGGDAKCTDVDLDRDGYTATGTGNDEGITGTDCVDDPSTVSYARYIYPGISTAYGCSAGQYRTCQTDGTWSSCSNLSSFTCKSGTGADYWIDVGTSTCASANDYTHPSDWRCFSDTGMSNYHAPAAGDCFIFKTAGTYDTSWSSSTKHIYVSNKDCSSADHCRITVLPGQTWWEQGEGSGVLLSATAPTGDNGVIQLIDSNYWDVDGIEATSDGNVRTTIGIWGNGGTGFRVWNSNVHGIRGEADGNLSGIRSNGQDTVVFHHNVAYDNFEQGALSDGNIRDYLLMDTLTLDVHHNVSYSTGGNESGRGIRLKHGAAGSGASYVRYNIIFNKLLDGISVGGYPGLTISRNYLDTVNTGGAGSAIAIEPADGGSPDFSDILVEYNTIYRSPFANISPDDNTAVLGSPFATFQYNVISDNRSTAYPGDGTDGFLRIMHYGSDAAYGELITGATLSIDYNCYYNSAGTALFFSVFGNNSSTSSGATYSSYALWKAGTSFDAHSFNENPTLDVDGRATSANCTNLGWKAVPSGTTTTTSVATTTTIASTTTTAATTTTTVSSSGSTATGKPGAFDRIRRQ